MYGQMPFMMPNALSQVGTTANAANALGKAATGTSFLGRINWSSLLSNTQKVLNVANQAIPLYYQAKPLFQNIKALGKIGKEFSKIGTQNTENSTNNISSNTINNTINDETSVEPQEDLPTPKFFL